MDLQTIKQRFGIIGNTPAMNHALEVAVRVAATDLSVLVTGESGVGKEFFPQIIHSYSSRKHNNYIAVNCGAIPEGTIDSELFGHEKGAFTGATDSRKGYFEEADGGTIFLDEVAELPLTTQVRLLRVLQTGEYIRVGSSRAQKTNVRVVAATNINLHYAIEAGRFREDLYYRLNTVPIVVPPLRDRSGDVFLLFRKFAVDIATQYRMPPISLTAGARQALESYRWPGNIRQLKNVAEQISAIETDREIQEQTLTRYLPNYNVAVLPAVRGGAGGSNSGSSSSYSSENSDRDILYKLLFDLRGEVSELKGMMAELAGGGAAGHGAVHGVGANSISAGGVSGVSGVPSITSGIATGITAGNRVLGVGVSHGAVADYVDTEDVEATPITKQDRQREMIVQALGRHNGRRREAAAELFMSERTLYRKIKELGIE